MLLAIRERVMGILGWIILALLIVAFAFFGLNSYMQSNVVDYAARVNDVEISRQQLDRAYSSLQQKMRENMGDRYDPSQVDEDSLKEAALHQLISNELVVQATDEAGFAVTEAAVAAYINEVEAFRKDGVFSKELYRRFLGYQGMSPGYFQWEVRRELVAGQLRTGIIATAAGTRNMLDRVYRLQGQQRRFDYLVIPASTVAGEVSISDEEISSHYEASADAYMTPEQATVRYIDLNATELELPADFTEEEIRAEYEASAGKYIRPEERHARHILVAAEDNEDTTGEAAAHAAAILERIRGGEGFAELARELSDDPATADSGGDLGFFPRGLMIDAFDEAVFVMEPGEISEPVQTEFGYHIIELLDIRPEQATPIEEVGPELIAALQGNRREDRYYELYDELANLVYENPDTLQTAADTLGLEIHETGPIGRDGGPGIGGDDRIVEAIFSEDVLIDGNNSPLIEIGDNHVVALRVTEHIPARRQPLDAVRDSVEADLRKQKIRTLLENRGETHLAALRNGDVTLQSLADPLGQKVVVNPLLGRAATGTERAILGTAFSMYAPREGSTAYAGVFTRSGDYALLALHEIRDGVLESLPEERRKLTQRGLARVVGTGELRMVLDMMESRAEISIPGDGES